MQKQNTRLDLIQEIFFGGWGLPVLIVVGFLITVASEPSSQRGQLGVVILGLAGYLAVMGVLLGGQR